MNLAGVETNYQEIIFSDNPGQNCWDNSRFFPPPMTMLIFHGLRNRDPFIDRSHVSTFSGDKGGPRKTQRKKNTRCSYNDGSMYSKFSTFRPKFDKCPKVF